MSCSQCHLKFHLKCFCSDESGVKCNSCLINNNNTQDRADQDQQENIHRYDIPELSELVSRKGLKILHQNIRGLLANRSIICQILDGFRNIHIFSLSETHLSPETKPRSKLKIARLLQSQGLLVKVEVLVFTFLHLFPFKDGWISNKRILNASGLKYYFLKPKAF